MAAANTQKLRYHLTHSYLEESPYLFSREGMTGIRSPKNPLLNFLLVPLLCATAVFPPYVLFVRYFALLPPLVLFLLVFPMYHLLFRTTAYHDSFLAEGDAHIVACGCTSDQLFAATLLKSAV